MTDFEEAAAKAKEQRALVKTGQSEAFLQQVNLDWKQCPPAALARLIAAVPYGQKDGIDVYYSDIQAIILAQSCFEMGLSPFRNHAYLNPKNNKLALYVEGQQELARIRGIKIGPARYQEVFRPYPVETKYNREKIATLKLLGFEQDPGITCSIEVLGFKNEAVYTCWGSEWIVVRNPVWLDRFWFMIRTRAKGKTLAEITGADISEDIASNEKFEAEVVTIPQITATPVTFSAPPINPTQGVIENE